MKFSEIYGHKEIKEILKRAIENKNVGHAYIFSGPEGVGRLSTAKAFSKALVCTDMTDGEPCGKCKGCRMCDAESHPDIRIVTNGLYDSSKKSSNILIDTIRNMKREIYVKPIEAERKIYIIPNADTMNISAQNSILKILEEPPMYCTIIMIVKNTASMLETVLSRAQNIKFFPLKDQEVEAYLRDKRVLEESDISYVSKMAEGSIGEAIKIASDEDRKVFREEVLDAIFKILKPSQKNLYDFVSFLKKNKGRISDIEDILRGFFSDLIKICELKDGENLLNKDKIKELDGFSKLLTDGGAVLLMDILIKTKLDIEQNVNYATSVLMMAIDFWEVLHDRSNRSKI